MDIIQVAIIVGSVVVGLVLLIIAVLSTWKKIPSDKAAVIVGMGKPKVVTGGGTIVIPLFQQMDKITLENIMFAVKIEQTKTSLGVPINAEGIVVLKVKNDRASILAAVQQFNCSDEKSTVEMIKSQASEICKGKLREIVSSMSVEDIYNDREAFASKVQLVAGTELGEMGLELKSFTINDINDSEGYIEALGKEQIAKVKSAAAIAEALAAKEREVRTAEAERDQRIMKAEAVRRGTQAELEASTQIAEATKEKEVRLAAYRKEQEARKAEADAAYVIQQNITSKEVKNTAMDAMVLEAERKRDVANAEMQIEIAREQKAIELAAKRAERKRAELQETMIAPAEADKSRKMLEAEATKFQEIQRAQAEAEKMKLEGEASASVVEMRGRVEAEVIRQKGLAEADSIREKGLAEAEALDKRAEALQKMEEAGMVSMVIEKLPEIARAISEPLSRIDGITIISGGEGEGGVADVARYTASGLRAVRDATYEVTGFDLFEVMKAKTFEGVTTRNINVTSTGESTAIAEAAIASVIVDEKDK